MEERTAHTREKSGDTKLTVNTQSPEELIGKLGKGGKKSDVPQVTC